ncbi:MAG: hypothetical protein FWD68_20630 [Alphaproteobacteria bacterium]|nr:hypothetical protein [Alphaproteobacteria bacterium]
MQAIARILAEVDPLSHNMRWRHMVEFGRQSIRDSDLAEALNRLAGSEVHYERLLALMSAGGSGDGALVARMLSDPSQILVTLAVKIAVRTVPDDMLIARMAELRPALRTALAQRLCRAGREAVNDSVYRQIEDKIRLLPWTSVDVIRRDLDRERMAMLSARQWSILAGRVPAMVRDVLLGEVERAPQPSHFLRQAVEAALAAMLRGDRPVGLSLLAVARYMPLNTSILERYASHFPGEVAAILGGSGHRGLSCSRQALRRLEPTLLCELMRSGRLHIGWDFSGLRPSQREALYREAAESWRENTGALPHSIVRALAGPTRQAEARHAFALPLLASEPMRRLPYLSCLPVEEALRLARPFLSQPQGELRAAALAAVVGAGRYEAGELSTLLKFCLERENEQDPVRLAMFNALAELPPLRWQADHLPFFTALIDAALRARDCSHPTMTAATRWLMGIIVLHCGFVAATLPRLVERMGEMASPGWRYWESRVTDRQMVVIAPQLINLMKTWIKRERAHFAVQLILCCGRRAKAVDLFADLLTALTDDRRSSTARSGLDSLIWIGHRKRVAELIPRLIAKDPCWIHVDAVVRHLHRHRQDLLTPFLTARVYRGRFSSGTGAFVPRFEGGFYRWSAAQQRIYAGALDGILQSPKRNAWELYRTISMRASLPSADLACVIDLAALNAADRALSDKALEALGRADAGRGVAALLHALEDNRSRVAIFALRRALLNMPVSKALELLGKVPASRITVAKEVIRLAGELKTAAAFEFLGEFAADGDLHQDLRIALLRAYWNYLDRDEVWQVLRDAARAESAIARSTIRIPQTGLSRSGQQALTDHLALLLGHRDAQIRKETLERLIAVPVGRGGPALSAALKGLLNDIDPDVTGLAARTLLACDAREQPQQLAESFARVERAESLVAIVSAYQSWQWWAAAQGLEESASLLMEALLARRWHPGQALRLAFLILKPLACRTAVERFDAAGLLHPGAVQDAIAGAAGIAARTSPLHLAALERSLGSSASVAMRRIGLALLCVQGGGAGWSEATRLCLDAYRDDRERWISDEADLVRCPERPAALRPPLSVTA